jgi:hypothetical protein
VSYVLIAWFFIFPGGGFSGEWYSTTVPDFATHEACDKFAKSLKAQLPDPHHYHWVCVPKSK